MNHIIINIFHTIKKRDVFLMTYTDVKTTQKSLVLMQAFKCYTDAQVYNILQSVTFPTNEKTFKGS